MSNKTFRTDINGLRAIAVISVVFFHFSLQGFEGGFVGVDIFFVISGFLMTGIIVKGLENKKFSIIDFYIARARRIIPALALLCLVLLVVGWFLIAPDDYSKLAREADRALLFLSNNYYYKNSGYFDTESHERMLLHTWTLSVEWQFYIIYPLVLVGLSKLGLNRLPYAICILFIGSFSWSVYKSYVDPNYAFYLLPSRAWEMMLGGLAFYLSRTDFLDRYKNNIFYIGLTLILLAIFVYDPETRWPGVAALLPTLGTGLVIYAGKNNIFLSNIVAQKLGDWSYSIYLWHWPLVVALILVGIDEFTWLSIVLILLSVFLGWLSFSIIENPLRKYLSKKNNWITLLVILIALAVILFPAEKIRKNKGYIERLSGEVYRILNAANDRFEGMDKCHNKRNKNYQECIYGEGHVGVIVMGDSHAMSFLPAVVEAYAEREQSVLDLTRSGCPTLFGVNSIYGDGCKDFLAESVKTLEKYKDIPIYLSNRYSAFLVGDNEKESKTMPVIYFDKEYSGIDESYTNEINSNYMSSICAVAENNPVYMFRPVPELIKHVPKTMGRSLLYKGKFVRVSVSREYYEKRNRLANKLIDELEQRCGIVALEVADYLCDENHCYGDIDGQPIYFDDDHLNTKGAKLFLDTLIDKASEFKE